MKDVLRMMELATDAHKGQVDKANVDYILHPIRVAQIVTEQFGADPELIQIALGHDLIEDTAVTSLYLRCEGFSDRVVDGIIAITKLKSEKTEKYQDYKDRVFANEDAMKVKWADLTHNLDASRLAWLDAAAERRFEKYRVFKSELDQLLGL